MCQRRPRQYTSVAKPAALGGRQMQELPHLYLRTNEVQWEAPRNSEDRTEASHLPVCGNMAGRAEVPTSVAHSEEGKARRKCTKVPQEPGSLDTGPENHFLHVPSVKNTGQ